MEIAALESDRKQMEWSGNGTKQAEIMQKIFPHFFVYSSAEFEGGAFYRTCGSNEGANQKSLSQLNITLWIVATYQG